MVIPPSSEKFIPEVFRNLLTERLADIAPKHFIQEAEALVEQRDIFAAIVIMPFVDPLRVVNDLSDYKIPKEYMEKMPYFIKNIRKVFVPFRPTTLNQIIRYEEREKQKIAERWNNPVEIPSPSFDLKQKIKVIEKQNEEERKEKYSKDFKKFHKYVWKQTPLM